MRRISAKLDLPVWSVTMKPSFISRLFSAARETLIQVCARNLLKKNARRIIMKFLYASRLVCKMLMVSNKITVFDLIMNNFSFI